MLRTPGVDACSKFVLKPSSRRQTVHQHLARQISYIIRVEFLIKEMEGVTYVIYQDAAVIRGTFGREKINGQRRVSRPVSGRHALRRPKISRVDGAHETLI